MCRNCFAASMGCKKEGHAPHYVTTSATEKNKNNDVALCFWLTLDHNSRRGFSTKFYIGRLRAEVQPLNPFIYVPFLTDKIPFPILSIDKWCVFQHTSVRTLHPFFVVINVLFWVWKRKITKPERFLEFLTSVLKRAISSRELIRINFCLTF